MSGSGSEFDPDPQFDAIHPSGRLMFRSCPGGYLHSVVLSEDVRGCDAGSLAEAVLRAADVSHLRAVMRIRREIIDSGFTPSEELSTPTDLRHAEDALRQHRLLECEDG